MSNNNCLPPFALNAEYYQSSPEPSALNQMAAQAPQNQAYPITSLNTNRLVLPPESYGSIQQYRPTSLMLHIQKYLKISSTYMYRGKNNAKRKHLTDMLTKLELNLLTQAVDCEKRPSNKNKLYELDTTHESLRQVWRVMYEEGLLGEYKKGRAYSPQEGLRVFCFINTELDIIGRIIGSIKNKLKNTQ